MPINARIKHWAVHGPDVDTAHLLDRWELFNLARTLSAFAVFTVLVVLALRGRDDPHAGA